MIDNITAIAKDGWALVTQAQDILAAYLDPGVDSIKTEHEAINALFSLLDNAAVVKRGRDARLTIAVHETGGTPEEWEDFRDAQAEGWGGTFDEWLEHRELQRTRDGECA